MTPIAATFGDKGLVCEYCGEMITTEDAKRCEDGTPHCTQQEQGIKK